MAGARRLLAADFAISLTWVFSNELIKIFVQSVMGNAASQLEGDIARCALAVVNMFAFAYMSKATDGGAYNPLSVLAPAISGDFSNFIFTVGARIPAQVVGSVYGVRLILWTFPGIGHAPHLKVDIATGALTEGLLAFAIVTITLGLATQDFLTKTWISSLAKLTLHILAADLTGGCMNPAPVSISFLLRLISPPLKSLSSSQVMGWAFANRQHITKEHLIVYCLAPVEATLLAVWLSGILFRMKKDERSAVKKATSPQQKLEKSD
ncbi:probable aquaporin SIP2-1 isoform X1 [Salvia miltiorrhiza]|uniref:probable aquaporin SIP2-1 isoform X1 n=1 Tax=Salvia miltiorrhiza TaxID=226208 RepID=UPI0025AB8B08|nr:probable aquaporin SIP2-1 isoform X1 [Salvia miltiorrhiza]